MKIAVLNGSPKGELSITLQYVRFIQKKYPQHEFRIIHTAQKIKTLERHELAFKEIRGEVKAADGILWSFPLYVFLVPSQYKRFVELIRERNAEGDFRGKYTAALSTSIHFFDHTAHNYMNAVCDDLGMKFAGFHSAEMQELLTETGREKLLLFAAHFLDTIEGGKPVSRTYAPLMTSEFVYEPGGVVKRIDPGARKVVVLTDLEDRHTNLGRMIERFCQSLTNGVEVINLHDIDIKGGCLGCCECALDNICVYKDGFAAFYRDKIRQADILIFAGSVRDRYLSAKWKEFFDRAFFNGHVPSLAGKQMGFIISGPLRQLPNLRQILQAYTEIQQSNLVDFVTAEEENSPVIDSLLQAMAGRAVRFAGEGFVAPPTFLSVGGVKIFRDEIYGKLRFVFQADYKFYRRHKLFDFPQKDKKAKEMNRQMLALMKNPEMREAIRKVMRTEMVRQYKEIVETM